MIRTVILAAGALALAACSTTGGSPTTAPVTKAQIAAIEVSVTEAERLAKVYLDQPVCPAAAPAVPTPCSVPATRLKVITQAHAAHDAFLTLQGASAAQAPAALAATLAALQLLQEATPTTQPAHT